MARNESHVFFSLPKYLVSRFGYIVTVIVNNWFQTKYHKVMPSVVVAAGTILKKKDNSPLFRSLQCKI